MISVCLLTLTLFLSPLVVAAQDSTDHVTASWLKLKSQMQRRNDIAIVLTGKLIASSKPVKQEYRDVGSAVKDLSACIDTLRTTANLNAPLIYSKNKQLTAALSRSLVWLENDTKMKSSGEVQDLLMQLEASENRLHMAILDFNKVCMAAGRPELIFRAEETDEAPKVRF